jgi:putative phosphoribosyl transferase
MEVTVAINGVNLPGTLSVPPDAQGVVVFAHGSGSSRLSPRNAAVARYLGWRGCATLLFDLLTPEEESNRDNVFDIGLLAQRMIGATRWLRKQDTMQETPIGYFGASTGAAAALVAAAELNAEVAAVVSRGGRPDLAGVALPNVTAPTLLIVGSLDEPVLEMNRSAKRMMRCESRLEIVPGATHLFEEPGTLEEVSRLAGDWFVRCFAEAQPARTRC